MARIKTVGPNSARGVRRVALWLDRRRYGRPLGITRIVLPDLQLALAVAWLYRRLHLRQGSPLTRLQREMLATVVNGKIGGAP